MKISELYYMDYVKQDFESFIEATQQHLEDTKVVSCYPYLHRATFHFNGPNNMMELKCIFDVNFSTDDPFRSEKNQIFKMIERDFDQPPLVAL